MAEPLGDLVEKNEDSRLSTNRELAAARQPKHDAAAQAVRLFIDEVGYSGVGAQSSRTSATNAKIALEQLAPVSTEKTMKAALQVADKISQVQRGDGTIEEVEKAWRSLIERLRQDLVPQFWGGKLPQ